MMGPDSHLMILLLLPSLFCFKTKYFTHQPFLPEIQDPVLMDLHHHTAQKASQSGVPPSAENHNTIIHLWLRLRLG